jgi:uncharacterized protein (TIGR03118 family)
MLFPGLAKGNSGGRKEIHSGGRNMLSSSRRASKWTVTILAAMVATFALPTQAQRFTRTDLTADSSATSSTAPNIDPNLINAWGMSRSSGSPWWISDNGTGLATLYDGAGVPQSLVVTIPAPGGGTSAPTGQVFNATSGFEIAPGAKAIFIFVTEDGTISGWNPGVDRTHAVIAVNNSGKAVYKGCALVQGTVGPYLYATNFQTGQVDVFDSKFKPVRFTGNPFSVPQLGVDWAPFGIQNVGGNLVVTFAHRKKGQHDEDHGPGLGHVGVFTSDGRRIARLQDGPWMNAPWGIAMAPSDFGQFNHRLLIGQFGSGEIHAFNAVTGMWEAGMLDQNGAMLSIDGLWGLTFGNNARSGSAIELYFTAGPKDESQGILGKLVPVSSEQRGSAE